MNAVFIKYEMPDEHVSYGYQCVNFFNIVSTNTLNVRHSSM
jgi:hypothetical protein